MMAMRRFPGTLERNPKGFHEYILTDEQREWLCHYFPIIENTRLMKASGMSHSTLHRFARDMHLTKSEKGIKAIKRRQAAHIRRVCERNGWYDKLRGRTPSDATRAATVRMWQDIREGKREHPTSIMKRQNPRRYNQWMKRKSEERKRTIEMERMRMKWGLPRKTRLKAVVMQPYRRSQVAHRFNAQRRGYIIADTCEEGSGHRYTIYYDKDTTRSEAFERNCIADGFRIRELES